MFFCRHCYLNLEINSIFECVFDVRSVLHGQVRLAAVNQICVIHEALNGYKICYENVNISS